MVELRQDQLDLKNKVYADWQHGVPNVLAVLSTGGGKSVIASKITLDGAREEKKQAIIAHRNELVSQMSAHIAREGIPHRIIAADKTVNMITRQHRKLFGRSFVNPSASTAVIGVDTLVSRYDTLKDWARQLHRWKIDEGHHVLRGNKWGKAVDMMPNAQGLGLTATPARADGAGLGRAYEGVFDTMHVGLDMRSLINLGALSDYEIVCPTSDLDVDDKEVGESGDWSNKTLRTAAKKSRIVGDVVTAYCMYAYGKQAICFATDVETAGEIAGKFNAWGIRAAAVSAETNSAVREKYIEEFRAGILKVLVNVDLFDEGFDVPACEVVIMARPTASLGKFRQMVGRCMRTLLGKLYGLIIDHVSNILRHGLPDKFIAWTLARRDKRGKQEKDPDDIPLTVCKFCTKPYERFMHTCPYCGMTPPLPEPRDRSIEMVDGDLILLDREKLAAMRAAIALENPADVASRAPPSARDFIAKGAINRQIEKIEAHGRLQHAIAQWGGIQRANGFDDSAIYRKFFLTTGVDMLTALDGSRSRQDFETLATRVEGWYLT